MRFVPLFVLFTLSACYQLDRTIPQLEEDLETLRAKVPPDAPATLIVYHLPELDSLYDRITREETPRTDERYQRLDAETVAYRDQLRDRLRDVAVVEELTQAWAALPPVEWRSRVQAYFDRLEQLDIDYAAHLNRTEELLITRLATASPDDPQGLLLRDVYAQLQERHLQNRTRQLRSER